MNKFWICLLVFAGFFSCKKNVKYVDLSNSIDLRGSAKERITSINENIYEFVSGISFIFLENTSGVNPDQIKSVIQSDNYVFLQNNRELRIFNKNGSEYQRIEDIDYFDIDTCNKQVVVFKAPDTIMYYSVSGDLINKNTIPTCGSKIHSFKCVNDGKLFIAMQSVDKQEIHIYDGKNNSIECIQHWENSIASLDYFYLAKDSIFRQVPLFVYSRDSAGLYYKYLFSDTIYKYNKSLSIDKNLYFGDDKVKFNPTDKKDKYGMFISGFWKTRTHRFFQFKRMDDQGRYSGIALHSINGKVVDTSISFTIPTQIIFTSGDSRLFSDQWDGAMLQVLRYDSSKIKPFFFKENIQLPDSLKHHNLSHDLFITKFSSL